MHASSRIQYKCSYFPNQFFIIDYTIRFSLLNLSHNVSSSELNANLKHSDFISFLKFLSNRKKEPVAMEYKIYGSLNESILT